MKGVIKQFPEDFIVHEQLSFELTNAGEHVYLHIQKRNLNTVQVAEHIARFANIKLRDIGYAGMKDKHAVTSQWFSLYLPQKPQINWHELNSDEVKLLEQTQHSRKCRIGALSGNFFEIVVRDVEDANNVEEKLSTIETQGMPNYFGEQRFGRHFGNIESALAMLENKLEVKNKKLKGIYYSTARAYLFNTILDKRVEQNTFNQAIAGDMMMKYGKHSYFSIEEVDDTIIERVKQREIVPAGPLWGEGTHYVNRDALAIEEEVFANLQVWLKGLVAHKLELSYRPYVVYPKNLSATKLDDKTLMLKFFLPRGAYATSLLRELGDFKPCPN